MKKHMLRLCVTCAVTVSCNACCAQELSQPQEKKEILTENEQTLTITGTGASRAVKSQATEEKKQEEMSLDLLDAMDDLDKLEQLEQHDPTLTEKIKMAWAYVWYKTLNAKDAFFSWFRKTSAN